MTPPPGLGEQLPHRLRLDVQLPRPPRRGSCPPEHGADYLTQHLAFITQPISPSGSDLTLQELAGHDHGLDVVAPFVDLGDLCHAPR
jgi:hypothetical protein